jgi:hypothetical protein
MVAGDLTQGDYDSCWGQMTEEKYNKLKNSLPAHTVKRIQTTTGILGCIEMWIWLN